MVIKEILLDEYGPEYVVSVYDPSTNMEGFLVIDNTLLGPGKGGVRMTPDITAEEVFRLARTMTWKNALAGIPFGGAKAGIRWNGGNKDQKKSMVQSFAKAISPFIPRKYIAGPDVNTGEQEMQWFVEATGNWRSATGKPANLCMTLFGKKGEKCGIPHEFGSTGFGVAWAVKTGAELVGMDMKGATVAIHGFGNVGSFAARHLSEMGAVVVAVADRSGAVYAEQGLDLKSLETISQSRKSISEYKGADSITEQEFWSLPVDILIPASVTDVIHQGNKNTIRAKIIAEGANIPMKEDIEEELFQKGILIIPDFVANAGGVISSYAEYRGYNPKRMFETVQNKIVKSTKVVLEQSMKMKRNPRSIALDIAKERIAIARKKRKNV